MSLRRTAAAVTGAVAAFGLLSVALPAQAATGQVVVFSTEFQELATWDNPSGCHKLPIAAHQLNNHTDGVVRVYADPFCLTPSLTIQPGYGTHVMPGTGSFSA